MATITNDGGASILDRHALSEPERNTIVEVAVDAAIARGDLSTHPEARSAAVRRIHAVFDIAAAEAADVLTDGYPIPLRGATAPYLEDPAACPPLTEGVLPLAEGLQEPEPAPCELDLIGAMRDAQRLLQEDLECSRQADVPRIQHCVILTESDGVLQYLHQLPPVYVLTSILTWMNEMLGRDRDEIDFEKETTL